MVVRKNRPQDRPIRERIALAVNEVYHAFDKSRKDLKKSKRAPNFVRWKHYMDEAGEFIGRHKVKTEEEEAEVVAVEAEIQAVKGERKDPKWRRSRSPPRDREEHQRYVDELAGSYRQRTPLVRQDKMAGPSYPAGEASQASSDAERLRAVRDALVAAARNNGIDGATAKSFWNRCLSAIAKNKAHWSPEHQEAVLQGLEITPGYIAAYAAHGGVAAEALASNNAKNPAFKAIIAANEDAKSRTEDSLATLAASHRRLGYRQSAIYGISRAAFARGF
ncbi:hypothetical protein JCM10207_002116 [Rhodosporidiobolus poonsookiae]